MISSRLPEFLPTEQDTWWFLAEQYDRSIDCGNMHRRMLEISPLQMSEIEYEGRKSENSYVGKPNAGVAYLKKARHELAAEVGGELADIAITQAFIFFAMQNMPAINTVRVKYATHFHNNCIRDGAYNNAERWQDAIDEIEGR